MSIDIGMRLLREGKLGETKSFQEQRERAEAGAKLMSNLGPELAKRAMGTHAQGVLQVGVASSLAPAFKPDPMRLKREDTARRLDNLHPTIAGLVRKNSYTAADLPMLEAADVVFRRWKTWDSGPVEVFRQDVADRCKCSREVAGEALAKAEAAGLIRRVPSMGSPKYVFTA